MATNKKTEETPELVEMRESWMHHPYTQVLANQWTIDTKKAFETLLGFANASSDPKVASAAATYTHAATMLARVKAALR